MPPDILKVDEQRTVTDDDVNNIRGVDNIDDDNDPLPENIPSPTEPTTSVFATSEVNANLDESAFGEMEAPRPQLKFRRLLASDLITNKDVWEYDSPSQKRKRCHESVKLPPGKKFPGTKIVKAKSRYVFNYCACRANRVGTYCRCTPEHYDALFALQFIVMTIM